MTDAPRSRLPDELAVLVADVGGLPPELELTPTLPPTPEPTPAPAPTPTPTPAPVFQEPPLSRKRERGNYILEEADLPDEEFQLLHGRAFVVDRVSVSAVSSGSPLTYYIAYDQIQGLVVPARSVSVENTGPGLLYYRWTDDGEKWTAWVTLDDGETQSYRTDEKCRFAEMQVYVDDAGTLFSLRATR